MGLPQNTLDLDGTGYKTSPTSFLTLFCYLRVRDRCPGVDTPLQVFPVHTPVRRGQSGTPSQGYVVPGQVRRALAWANPK